MARLASFIIILVVAVVFGYCGGKNRGFHKLLNFFGIE